LGIDFILLDSQYLQIIDCEAASGLAYWKQKKVYCVEAANFQSKRKGRKED
jgi:hypothetical protein